MNIGFIFVLKAKWRCIDSLLDSQISSYNEYKFCHLLHEWLYSIIMLVMIILLYNSYSTCNNQVGKWLREPGTSGKTIQMEWKVY